MRALPVLALTLVGMLPFYGCSKPKPATANVATNETSEPGSPEEAIRTASTQLMNAVETLQDTRSELGEEVATAPESLKVAVTEALENLDAIAGGIQQIAEDLEETKPTELEKLQKLAEEIEDAQLDIDTLNDIVDLYGELNKPDKAKAADIDLTDASHSLETAVETLDNAFNSEQAGSAENATAQESKSK